MLMILTLFVGVLPCKGQLSAALNDKESKTAQTPKVSVIIPVYNAAPYLSQSLDSILGQTLGNIEIICVSDGSTDDSLEILCKYSTRFPNVTIVSQKHACGGTARNTALKLAKGEYIVFVDADDYAEPDYLELMYNKMTETGADICMCRAVREDVKSGRVYEEKKLLDIDMFPKKETFSYKDCPQDFFQITNTVAWNKMFKRELIEKNNLLFQELPACNDYFFVYASLVKAEKITVVDKILYTQRINHDTNIHSQISSNPYCYLDASSKLYDWLVAQGLYNILQTTFIKSFVKLADYNVFRCKENKDLYLRNFNIAKEMCKRYEVRKHLGNMNSEFLLRVAKIFLNQTAEQRYKKVCEIYNLKPQPISIAMATDNNYVLPTIVAITSMLENAKKETTYKCNLLISGDFTYENYQKFLDLNKKYPNKCEFNFINMSDTYKGDKEVGTRITTPMYYRLSLPSLLNDTDKCLYIDGDTIIEKDLSELYNMDLTNYYLAGVRAACFQSKNLAHAERLGIPSLEQYVNSGVLLMNLQKMREDGVEEKFADFIKNVANKNENITCPDQDTINAICYDGIKLLPFKYNTMTKYYVLDESAYKKKGFLQCYPEKEWNDGRKNPTIIHYADKIKPWHNKDTAYADVWWKYAKKTSFFAEIEKQYSQHVKSEREKQERVNTVVDSLLSVINHCI